MAVKFVPNPAIGPILARTPEMMAVLLAAAEAGAAAARSIAPVGATGKYRDGIGAEVEPGRARINANDYKSNWIEFGTGQPGPTPAFAPLRRGAEMAGLRLTGGSTDVRSEVVF